MNVPFADPAEQVGEGPGITPENGLGQVAASLRLAADGPNPIPGREGPGLLRLILDVAREPMFLLLLAAGAVYMLMGEASDALMLLGFVVVIIAIAVVQQMRTGRSVAALRELSAPLALVIRDGQRRRVPVRELVRGDLLVISEGDRLPADAVLRVSNGLTTDESLLTGESMPVTKTPDQSARTMDPPGGDGLASLYMGTMVVSGQGVAEVLAVGRFTQLGRIGRSLSLIKPGRCRLQQETGRLVRNLAIVGTALCCMVVVVYALTRGGDSASWRQGLLAGITMAMAMVPEEFPVILTVFLALGAWRISRARVLARRMPAIEILGATTVLCTDKTGTLTLNRMAVTQASLGGHIIGLTAPTEAIPENARLLLETAALACRAVPFDPMERAIHEAADRIAPDASPRREAMAVEREYAMAPELLAVSLAWRPADGGRLMIASKGAPEAICGLCGLSAKRCDAIEAEAIVLASHGLRVLGIARTSLDRDRLPRQHSDLDLEFLGLIGLQDPLRPEVATAVAECRTAGIRVVLITGDFPATAQAIAREAGIADDHLVITGSELSRMPDEELMLRIRKVQVFARMAPQQKLRLVMALRANHEVVAMTGDGVNDAPALKAAHIGIAMGGRGSDIAREAAGLVLLDDDFASIVTAIRMGRRIFDNIRKAVAFTFAVHVPIVGLSILPVFLPDWPLLLLPVHIVFLELVIDPSCTLVYESEEAEDGIMTKPPRPPAERLYSWRGFSQSLLQGGSATAVCIAIFFSAHDRLGEEAARTLTFLALVSSAMAMIIVNRSWSRSPWRTLAAPNPAQRWVVIGTAALIALILALPTLRGLFHFAPLQASDLALGFGAGIVCLAWFGLLKRLARPPAGAGMLWGEHPIGPQVTSTKMQALLSAHPVQKDMRIR